MQGILSILKRAGYKIESRVQSEILMCLFINETVGISLFKRILKKSAFLDEKGNPVYYSPEFIERELSVLADRCVIARHSKSSWNIYTIVHQPCFDLLKTLSSFCEFRHILDKSQDAIPSLISGGKLDFFFSSPAKEQTNFLRDMRALVLTDKYEEYIRQKNRAVLDVRGQVFLRDSIWGRLLEADEAYPASLNEEWLVEAFPQLLSINFFRWKFDAGLEEKIEDFLFNKGLIDNLNESQIALVCCYYLWKGETEVLIRLKSIVTDSRLQSLIDSCFLILNGNIKDGYNGISKFCSGGIIRPVSNISSERNEVLVFTFLFMGALADENTDKLMKIFSHLESGTFYAKYMTDCFDIGRMISLICNKKSKVGISFFTEIERNINAPWLSFWMTFLVPRLENSDAYPHLLAKLVEITESLDREGIFWMSYQMASVLSEALPDGQEKDKMLPVVEKYAARWKPLQRKVQKKELWKSALDELNAIIPREEPLVSTDNKSIMLVWEISLHELGKTDDVVVLNMEPKVKKMRPDGAWSKGRVVSLEKLYTGTYNAELDSNERHTLRSITATPGWGGMSYDVGGDKLHFFAGFLHLVGCMEGKSFPMKWEQGKIPVLIQENSKGEISLSFLWKEPKMQESAPYFLKKEGEGAYRIYPKSRSYFFIQKAIHEYGTKGSLTFPAEAKTEIFDLSKRMLKEFSIVGALSDIQSEATKKQEAQINFVIRISWLGQSLVLDLKNRPLEGDTYCFVPGKGAAECLMQRGREVILLKRNIAEEKRALSQFLVKCSALSEWNTSHCHWQIDEREDILNGLDVLQELQNQGMISLEWQEEKKWIIATPFSDRMFSLTAKGDLRKWFEIGGTIKVNENTLLTLCDLLKKLKERVGNYIPLDEHSFLKLKQSVIKRLELLYHSGTIKGGKLRLSPAALPALEAGFREKDDFRLPRLLQTEMAKLRECLSATPLLPMGLRATLRPYQREGFVWMKQLSDCGLGCCLADDMGLGKTLQILALLLERAEEGPSLVIVPTSLCLHWEEEVGRFTPSLSCINLYQGDRQNRISEARKGNVVICSYGLLAREAELLSSIEWNCLILDEAQQIKNRMAMRSKSAKLLNAKVRITSTGTPVENNLSELWSLFDFINPGLLGSYDYFCKTYCEEESPNPYLKKLISPLILRRNKAEVLEELPPKTEITRMLTLSAEERALYEQVRGEALKQLGKDENRISVLAHLMKLRRLCCHPSLAFPETDFSGSKLESAMELVHELRANGHRTLVFSQFVDVLSLLREIMDKEGITYQYLDGATSIMRRQELVQEFQKGKGEFFLISLKAGGTGLNLTAANYVILMDPWWNPAVDNQAADRTHRIGQTEAVTVYRLICQDTVEERVLELHAKKQSLAEDILEGTAHTRITLEDMMGLFK